jgi:hypothetical protein
MDVKGDNPPIRPARKQKMAFFTSRKKMTAGAHEMIF